MKKVDDEMKANIIQQHNEGVSFAQIGRNLGIHGCTVAYWANGEQREITKAEARKTMAEYTKKRDDSFKSIGVRRCPQCHITKNINQFYKGQRLCKICQDSYNSEYSKVYRPSEKRKEYLRKRKQEHKKEIAIMLGGKCAECGRVATDANLCAFDFHHLNIFDKEHRDECRCKQFIEKVKQGKIQLLCAFCHRIVHHKNGDRSYNTHHIKKLQSLR
jgi:hypothetical protein